MRQQLDDGLQPAQSAYYGGCFEDRSLRSDGEGVGLVFFRRLHLLSGTLDFNREIRRAFWLGPRDADPKSPLQSDQRAFDRCFEPSIGVTGNANLKSAIHDELPGADLEMRRHRHQVQ